MRQQIENMHGLINYGWDKVLEQLKNNFQGSGMNGESNIYWYGSGLDCVPPKRYVDIIWN